MSTHNSEEDALLLQRGTDCGGQAETDTQSLVFA